MCSLFGQRRDHIRKLMDTLRSFAAGGSSGEPDDTVVMCLRLLTDIIWNEAEGAPRERVQNMLIDMNAAQLV